jgi:hypothetical protein
MYDESGRPFVTIHECWGDHAADVIVSCLAAHGIATRTNTEIAHSLFPLAVDGLGKVEILVAEDDVKAASFILREQAGYGGVVEENAEE